MPQSFSLSLKVSKMVPGWRVRGLLGDSAWQFGETLFAMLIGLLVGSLVARHLSTDGFGTMNYVAAVMALVGAFSGFGLDSVVTREVATSPQNSHTIISTALRITLVTGFLGTLSVLGFANFGDQSQPIKTGLSIAAIGGMIGPLGIFYGVLKANFLSGRVSRYRIILTTIFGAIRLAMVFAGASVQAFIAALVIEQLTSTTLCYALCRKYNLLKKPASPPTTSFLARARPMATEGLPLMLSFIMLAVYSRVGLLMLEHYRGIGETGLYSAGARLSEIWNFIPGILVGTFLPHFAQIRESDPERFLRTIRIFAAAFFWGTLLVIGFTFVAAPLLIQVLFGSAFSDATAILRIHICSFTAVCMGGLITYWYIMEKLQRFFIVASVVGVLTNILLNLVWIPKFGGAGAAAATAVSYSLAVITPLFLFSKTRHIRKTIVQGIFLRKLALRTT